MGRGILSSPECTPCIARDIGFAVKKKMWSLLAVLLDNKI